MDYFYKLMPLEPTSNHIRLLSFEGQGRNKDEPGIQCSIIKAPIGEKAYHALSYVWGDPTLSEPLIVNGSTVRITKNLSQALQTFQAAADSSVSGKKEHFIWVDALCVNQSDTREKSAQVQRMDEIYKCAEAVLAWVGHSADDSDLVMQECNSTGMKLFVLSFASVYDNDEFETFTTDSTRFDRLAAIVGSQLADDTIPKAKSSEWALVSLQVMCEDPVRLRLLTTEIKWLESPGGISIRNAWIGFMKRDFWKRIWILQEMVLGKTVYLLCGSSSTRLEFYLAIWSIFMSQPQFGRESTGVVWSRDAELYFSSLFRLSAMLNPLRMAKMTPLKLVPLIEESRRLAATQLEDKIYGLLGVASDSRELGVQVDYSKTFPQICTDLATKLIKKEGVPSLSYALSLPGPVEVPSWVTFFPFLKDPGYDCFNFSQRRRAIDFDFSASGETSQSFDDRTFVHPRQLKVIGTTVDEVETAGYVNESPFYDGSNYNPDIDFKVARDTIIEIELVAATVEGNKSYRNKETAPLWWLPVLHRAPSSADAAIHDEYEAWTDDLRQSYMALRESTVSSSEGADENLSYIQGSDMYRTQMRLSTSRRAFFVTSKQGLLGVGPRDLKKNDKIVIFRGGQMPFAIRPVESCRFRLLGQVYVLGVMHGEFMLSNPRVEQFILE